MAEGAKRGIGAVDDVVRRGRQEKARRVIGLLVEEYGQPNWMPSLDPLSELIATILSQHTSDANSHRAFSKLRATFPDWQSVRKAPEAQIAEAIRSGGLAAVKSRRIKETLNFIAGRLPDDGDGHFSLSFLSQMDLPEAKAWLRAIPGVGPKTAACVLMFGLNRPALPVDTHVYRVSSRLGLIDPKTSVDAAHDQLEALLSPQDVYAFHVDMVNHGRRVCRPKPRCPVCNLREGCDYYYGLQRT